MWSSYPYPWSVMAADFIMVGLLACLPYSEASFQTDIFSRSTEGLLIHGGVHTAPRDSILAISNPKVTHM